MSDSTPVFTYDKLGLNGRLGNQLWQIAWQVGQARTTGGSFSIPSDWPYRPFFSFPEGVYDPQDGPTVDGGSLWYQELHHWEHCMDEMLSYLQPSQYALDKLQEYGKGLLVRSPKCSIHFRRGDYLNTPDGFPIPSMNYYRKCVSLVQDDEGIDNFLVFTDGYDWVKLAICNDSVLGDLYSLGFLQIVHGETTPVDPLARIDEPKDILDLFLMAECDEHIIANSTFSWWGAMLSANRRAYYPSRWWGQGMKRIKDARGVPITSSYREAFPADWIEVQSD